MRFTTTFALLLAVTLAKGQPSLGTNNGVLPSNTKEACIVNAGRLLNEVFTLMEKNYYRKDMVAWDSLLVAARQRLQNSQSCEDAYETIGWCFSQMKENHSFIMPAIKAAEYNNDTSFLRFMPDLRNIVGEIKSEIINDSIAYFTLPWINTTDEFICNQLADSLQRLIASLDKPSVTKWIIDLRKNTGGNCWPMLAGVGPLLGNGTVGYFVRNQEKVPIIYQDGMALQGKNIRSKVNGLPYRLKAAPTKIILLTSSHTSSSGEIITMAFKGRADVEVIGEPTAGLTTANATYKLSNNAMLVLTVCQEADRHGRIYEGRIRPDQWVEADLVAGAPDLIKCHALRYLGNQ